MTCPDREARPRAPLRRLRIAGGRLPAVGAALLVLCLGFACNLGTEEGRTFINVRKDTAWVRFDSLEIAWTDSASGAGGLLFRGDPDSLQAVNRLEAQGYDGGKITITIKGFRDGRPVYEERRGFDGANPAATTRDIVLGGPGKIDSPAVVPAKPAPPRLTPILTEPVLSIHDSAAFLADAVLDSGSLKAYAFDYDGDGRYDDSLPLTGLTARIRGGHRYHAPATYRVALKVLAQTDSAAIAQVTVRVLLDAPIADAGPDTAVYPGTLIRLHGRGEDGLGRIVKTEWKIGDGPFNPAPRDTAFPAPAGLGTLHAVFRVTDDDTLSAVDSVLVHVISPNESNLTGILPSKGVLAPQFDPAVFAYTDTVPFDADSLTITPTGNGVLTVNGQVVASGTPSGAIPVPPGTSTVTVKVKLEGSPEKVYAITVVRPAPSANTRLVSLSVRAGALDTVFTPSESGHAFAVVHAQDSATIAVQPEDSKSTVTVGGVRPGASLARTVPLQVGPNPIPVVVTAQNGATRTYPLTLTRAGAPDTTPSRLTALAVSRGRLSPPFSPALAAYADTVAVGDSTLTLTPEGNGSITVNGTPVTSGQASQPIALGPGTTLITVQVKYGTAPEKTVTVAAYRPAPPSGNADLAALGLSAGTLDTAFRPSDTLYRVAVPHDVVNLDVTPRTADTGARFTVTPTPPLALKVGDNPLSIQVTAQNGARKTYALTVTRAGSPNADLSWLSVSPGVLDTAFRAYDTLYQVSVANTVLSATVTATAADSAASVALDPPSPVDLKVGTTVVTAVVTAQDGTRKTYAISFTRAPSENADLRSISVSPGALDTVFTAAKTGYTVYLPDTVATATVAASLADTTARLTMTPPSPISLSPGDNRVTLRVTAQSGAVKTYTVNIIRRLKIIAASGGLTHTLVLREDNTLVFWGTGWAGEGFIPPGLKAKGVASGSQHVVAIQMDGTLNAWGRNDDGQATLPPTLTGVTAVSGGVAHSAALKSDGTVVVFGGDATHNQTAVPAGLADVKAVSAGGYHTLALKTDGTVVAWGWNAYGQCDIPPGLTGVKAISAGWAYNVALKTDGTVVAWGHNADGQCDVPEGTAGIQAVAAGSQHVTVLKSDGTLAAWGGNNVGQRNIPAGLNNVKAIVPGEHHTIAIKTDGTVVLWGHNEQGQCDIPKGVN